MQAPSGGWGQGTPSGYYPIVGNAWHANLGISVAAFGGAIAAGAPGETVGANIYQGAVIVLPNFPPSGEATLTASDGAAGSDLGESIAMDADTVVATQGQFKPGPSVYLWAEPAGGWQSATQAAKLTSSTGTPLGMVGTAGSVVVAVGADGALYIFFEPARGWADMNETMRLTSSDGVALYTAAISGSTVVVAGRDGAIHVFTDASSGWTELALLTASTGTALGEPNVTISGPEVASSGADGLIYVFDQPAGGWVASTESATVTNSVATIVAPPQPVAISGSTLIAGLPAWPPCCSLIQEQAGEINVYTSVDTTPPAVTVSPPETVYTSSLPGNVPYATYTPTASAVDDDGARTTVCVVSGHILI